MGITARDKGQCDVLPNNVLVAAIKTQRQLPPVRTAGQAAVQWEFCRCDHDWSSRGCHGLTECFAIDPAALQGGAARAAETLRAVAAERRIPVQLVRYAIMADGNGGGEASIVYGRFMAHVCRQI
mmetsp:Transcript_9948/g.25384  ORF Transcript_9948/g.25384 Transcript_9948/m.25384 type:complete len:125 (+) Transcript_9948:656-1030(+)